MTTSTQRWASAARDAITRPTAQYVLAIALLVPAVATLGQFIHSGFLAKSTTVLLLFWPGRAWSWGIAMPVWLSAGLMIASYVAGVGWMIHRRTLATVVLICVGVMAAAGTVGAIVNGITGWRELQVVASMDLAGRVDRAIFSMWHNPVWEEVVFRGIPLVALLWYRKRVPTTLGWAEWCYMIVPSVIFAAYHVPGHGPSRIADTLVIAAAFAWLALRYTFLAPLVLHYVLDAMMVMHLPKMANVPAEEVTWLADNFGAINSTWTVALLCWMVFIGARTGITMVRGGGDTAANGSEPIATPGATRPAFDTPPTPRG